MRWLVCAVLCLLATMQYLLPETASALIWQRGSLQQGQWWRLLTGHLVHLSPRHLLLNLSGLLLICELWWGSLLLSELLTMLLLCASGVSVLLWLLEPGLLWYAGLSGVLHGLWAGSAGAAWLQGGRWFSGLACGLLVIKLVWPAEAVAGMPVISVAHLCGALCGLFWLACRRLLQRSLVFV
ncbi:MAG: rhombosortase [Burkholderiaceae bacterium]